MPASDPRALRAVIRACVDAPGLLDTRQILQRLEELPEDAALAALEEVWALRGLPGEPDFYALELVGIFERFLGKRLAAWPGECALYLSGMPEIHSRFYGHYDAFWADVLAGRAALKGYTLAPSGHRLLVGPHSPVRSALAQHPDLQPLSEHGATRLLELGPVWPRLLEDISYLDVALFRVASRGSLLDALRVAMQLPARWQPAVLDDEEDEPACAAGEAWLAGIADPRIRAHVSGFARPEHMLDSRRLALHPGPAWEVEGDDSGWSPVLEAAGCGAPLVSWVMGHQEFTQHLTLFHRPPGRGVAE